jgi:sulfatase maturation enzyme AslB (radical SAM superfamily)
MVKASQIFEEDASKITGHQMNIIYVTTRCNLACEYCFEEEKRQELGDYQRDASKEEVDAFIDNIIKREGTKGPTGLLFFGGEPLLRMDTILYTMEQVFAKIDGYLNIMIETNGILVKKYINELLELNKRITSKHNSTFLVQVSYDGPHSDRRIWRGNKQSAKSEIEEALEILKHSGIRYGIAYTVNKQNIDHIVHDMVYMCEYYPNVHRFSITHNWNEIDNHHPDADAYQLKDILEACYMNKIYKKYKIKMCQEVCSICEHQCIKLTKMTNDIYLVPQEGVRARPKYNTYQSVFFKNYRNLCNNQGSEIGSFKKC